MSEDEWITNIFVIIGMASLLFTPTSLQIHFVSMLIVIYLIRDITINLTILPKNKNCKVDNKWYKKIINGCYDKIFSGHFSFTYLLSLYYYSYGIITNVPFLIIWNLLNAFVILITRSHYTIDIIMAFFVCSFIFTNNIRLPILDLT